MPEPAEPPPPLIGFALDSETDGDVGGRPSERLEVALHRCGVTVRYNTRAARAEFQHWQPRNRLDHADDRRFEMCAMQMTTPWEGWTDPTTAHVKEVLAAHFRYERTDGKKAPLKYGGDAWHNALGALMYRREVDPFVEWIEGPAGVGWHAAAGHVAEAGIHDQRAPAAGAVGGPLRAARRRHARLRAGHQARRDPDPDRHGWDRQIDEPPSPPAGRAARAGSATASSSTATTSGASRRCRAASSSRCPRWPA